MFDLTRPNDAYLFGLLQTDGTHAGSVSAKGRVSVELAIRDEDILHALSARLPCYSSVGFRARETNFSSGEDYRTAILRFYDQATRQRLSELGLPPGPKAHTTVPPVSEVSVPDYVRGLVDGDGSVGFTAKGYPFVSFVTASESLVRYFEAAVLDRTGMVRYSNPNTRDGVYNVMVCNEPAVQIAAWLYYADALALSRKTDAAKKLAQWVPPSSRFGVTRKRWTAEEDAVVLAIPSNIDAATALSRSAQSVNLRRWRLTNPA